MEKSKRSGVVVSSSEDKEPRKGQVHYVKTSKGLFPFSILKRYESATQRTKADRAASKQLKEEKMYMADKGLVPLPFEVSSFLLLQDNCPYLDACIRQIAQDIVGQGWELVLKGQGEEAEEDESPERKTALEEEKNRALNFLEDPNVGDETIEDIFKKCGIDWGAIGGWCLEVARDDEGNVSSVYHVPAHTVRVHKDGNKYCQVRGYRKRWFKRFDYEEDVHEETGEEENVPDDKKAHEMIFELEYYAQSLYYGAPYALSAVGAIQALIGIRDYNLAFFENYGVPAAIVTLTGDWEEGSTEMISDFLDTEIKGSSNAHKTLVFNTPEGGEAKWQPLVIDVKEGHFKLYHINLRDEILVAYKMPKYRIGITEQGSLGGNLADESTIIYSQSIVGPQKLKTQNIITKKLLEKGLGIENFEFWWNELDTRDEDKIADRCVKLFGIGGINRNEVREELGKPKLPDEEDGNRYYISTSYVPISEAGTAGPMGMQAAETAGEIEELKANLEEKWRAWKEKQHGRNNLPQESADITD